MPLDQEPVQEKEMSFLEHLEELRWHVVRSLAAVVIFTIAAFASARWIFENIIFAPARVDFPTFRWLCSLGHFFDGDFVAIYFASLLCGSFGALLLSADRNTVGASGAVFGLMGAAFATFEKR